MKIWCVRYSNKVFALYDAYNKAVIHAGDYWSMLTGKHQPVTVWYYKDARGDTLEEVRHIARKGLIWWRDVGRVVWKNGRPV